MRTIFFGISFFLLAVGCSSAQDRRLPRLAPIQDGRMISGIGYLRSPGLIVSSIKDKIDALGWESFSQMTSDAPYSNLVIEYSYVEVIRNEYSNNGWSVDPNAFLRSCSFFLPTYSQYAQDIRVRKMSGLSLWGVLDAPIPGGRIGIARGYGTCSGVMDYLPGEGGSTAVSMNGASHSSSHSINVSDLTVLQEPELIQKAVDAMFEDLTAKLRQRGYSFNCNSQALDGGRPTIPAQQQGGPPMLGGPPQSTHLCYRKFTKKQLQDYQACSRLYIGRRDGGVWATRETFTRPQLRFASDRVEVVRSTVEEVNEIWRFELPQH